MLFIAQFSNKCYLYKSIMYHIYNLVFIAQFSNDYYYYYYTNGINNTNVDVHSCYNSVNVKFNGNVNIKYNNYVFNRYTVV